MKELTAKQNQAVSARISYKTQDDAAKKLGLHPVSYRALMQRARERVDAHNTAQLIYLWTLAKAADSILDN